MEAHPQQLIEGALEGLVQHAREAFCREARRLEDDRPSVREAQSGDLEHGRAGLELESAGNGPLGDLLLGAEHDGTGGKSEAVCLLGETGEIGQIALDRRLGDEGAPLTTDGAPDQSSSLQVGQRLAQGEAVHAEPAGELTLWRETVTGLEMARADRLLYDLADLGVQRAPGPRDVAQPGRGVTDSRAAVSLYPRTGPHRPPPLPSSHSARRNRHVRVHGIDVFGAADRRPKERAR